ncbi:MAG: PH domain-containing protein [Lachnospiraceae bacterium]|nr:PH domain-containing protein [Lachnospiraceae bacterium]
MRGEHEMEDVKFRERKRWLFFGLPWTFTVYSINDELVRIDRGFFNKQQDDCYLYKIQDVRLNRSLFERIVGIGTIECLTGDNTDKNLVLIHVKHAQEIKDYLVKESENARLKRRTVNMLDIGADMDGDGMPDGN